MAVAMDNFSLDSYHSIGFDLDNTLVEYNQQNLTKLTYSSLTKFLVEKKDYDSNYLYQPMEEKFLQKGLFMDLFKGNIVKLGDKGFVLQACHGTRNMSDEEICSVYGGDKIWMEGSQYVADPLRCWNTPLEQVIRPVLDHFDMPCTLIFARIVDSLDKKAGKVVGEYNLWPDILEGLYYIFERKNFQQGTGGYFSEVLREPLSHYKKCSIVTLEWLKELKKTKFLFLLTGSNFDYANLTAGTGIGTDWKDYFDCIVYYARKPMFFIGERPFLEVVDCIREGDAVVPVEKDNCREFSQGNWKDMRKLISKKTNTPDPRVLYFGDNLIQDVYTPVKHKCCDAVAVVPELNKGNDKSNLWGSYFEDSKNGAPTFWNEMIKNHAKICISDLDVISSKSVNHKFSVFSSIGKSKSDGYHSRL